MNCECNNNSNRVKPRIKHVYGNVLRMAIPLTLRTLVKDGDEMIVNDTDFIPSSDHLVRVVFSKGKTNYPITATMDGNVATIEDKGKIPVGTYDISVECYDDLGNPYRFKQNAVLYVADTTAEAGIDEEIEYEAQTWYLNAAVFLATTEIGEIGDVIDAKLDDVFGNVLYDANAKEIRFYNKSNSRVLATIDSRPFIVDGTVADVYIDVSRQVLVVVLNEDAGGTRFSVPMYLVFNSYYKKDEVDSLVSRTVESVRFDFSQELPLVVPVTKNGSSISSPIDYGAIVNAIREDGRLVVACVNNAIFYQLLSANSIEIAFSRVVALDGYQELLIVNESNVWSMEDVDLGTGGGGGGYEPPAGGIPKSDLALSVQETLDDVVNKVDKETGKSLMTDAERTKLQNLPTADQLTQQLSTKANDADVVPNSRTVNGKALSSDVNIGMGDIQGLEAAIGEAGKVKTVSVNNGTPAQPDSNGNVNIEVQAGAQGPKGDTGNVNITDADELVTILVNDLTTGGAGNILSAEMGKLIGGREANDRARIDAIVSILKNAVFKDDESSAFAELDSLASAVDSISLNQSTIISSNGAQGDTYQLIATTSPAGGIVSWSSSDASVASVDNTGLVEIVGNGTCTITATSGGKTSTCSVTVSGMMTLPDGFQGNKAWTNTSEATSSGSYPHYDNSLTDLDGFCVTPFYPMIQSKNEGGITYSNYGIKIKGGFVSEGELEHVCFVVGPIAISEPSENEHVQFRILQTTNPMFKMSNANLAKSVSATFKLSELADCYIYDFVKGYRQGVAAGYLFAGSNVDTSKKPTKDNNDTYES